MALTQQQKQQINDAVATQLNLAKASLTALTQITTFEFNLLLENLISRVQLMKGECANHHFQELFKLLMHPNQLIQDIAPYDIPEAQLLVTNKIKDYLSVHKVKTLEAIHHNYPQDSEQAWYMSFAISFEAFNNENEIISLTDNIKIRHCSGHARRDRGSSATEKLREQIEDIQHPIYESIHSLQKFKSIIVILKFRRQAEYINFLFNRESNFNGIEKYYTPIPPYNRFDDIPNFDKQNPDLSKLKEHDGSKLTKIVWGRDYSIDRQLNEIDKLINYLSMQLNRLTLDYSDSEKYKTFELEKSNIEQFKSRLETQFQEDKSTIKFNEIDQQIMAYKRSVKAEAKKHRATGFEYYIKFNFWRNPASLNDFNESFSTQPANPQKARRSLGN